MKTKVRDREVYKTLLGSGREVSHVNNCYRGDRGAEALVNLKKKKKKHWCMMESDREGKHINNR